MIAPESAPRSRPRAGIGLAALGLAIVLTAVAPGRASAQPASWPYRGWGWYDPYGRVSGAVAARINTETYMMFNNYVQECVNSIQRNEQIKAKQHAKLSGVRLAQTFDRLRNHPEPDDVTRGDALNVLLFDLFNPNGSISEMRQSGSSSTSRSCRTFRSRSGAGDCTFPCGRLHIRDRDWPTLLNQERYRLWKESYVRAIEKRWLKTTASPRFPKRPCEKSRKPWRT